MSHELWIEGVIVEFKAPLQRSMIRRVKKNEVVLADVTGTSVSKYEVDHLNAMLDQGAIKLLADVREFGELTYFELNPSEQLEVNRRQIYVRRFHDEGVPITGKIAPDIISDIATQIGDTNPPSHYTVRRWYDRYVEAGGRMRGLYPGHRLKGNRELRIDERVVEIINVCKALYLDKSKRSMATVFRHVEDKIIAHNQDNPNDTLKAPTYVTVQNHVLGKSYRKRSIARCGSLKKELAGVSSDILSTRPLKRVEVDHTQLDIHVLHDKHHTLIGRPYLTALIDHYSHMIVGILLSFENPSSSAVRMACLNAFTRKQTYLEQIGVDDYWPAHGVPDVMVVDNGKEFWGKHFEQIMDSVGFVVQYCPIRSPHYKSRVERFFGIVNTGCLDGLPGVSRKEGKCAEGYNGAQEATLTFSEFRSYLVKWIVGVFHNLPIEEAGNQTPNELWDASESLLAIPDEEDDLDDELDLTATLMKKEERQLSGTGVSVHTLNYNSPILQDIYLRDGACKITLKVNEFDLGHILVFDPTNKIHLKVECTDYSYASGLSLYVHNRLKQRARKKRKSKMDAPNLNEARVDLMKEKDEFHSRNKRRKTQTTGSKFARGEKIGIEDISTKKIDSNVIQLPANSTTRENLTDTIDDDEEELSTDGWRVGVGLDDSC